MVFLKNTLVSATILMLFSPGSHGEILSDANNYGPDIETDAVIYCPWTADLRSVDFLQCDATPWEVCNRSTPQESIYLPALIVEYDIESEAIFSKYLSDYSDDDLQLVEFDEGLFSDDEVAETGSPESNLTDEQQSALNAEILALSEKFQGLLDASFWHDFFPIAGSEYSYLFWEPREQRQTSDTAVALVADARIEFKVDCDPDKSSYF